MTAIANLSTLINLATGGGGQAQQQINIHKSGLVAGAAPGTLVSGRISDLWQYDGQPGGAATSAPSSSSAVVNNATAGSWKQATPTAGTDLFLTSAFVTAHVAGSILFYDRLVQQGGLDATNTGAQTVSTPALTRFTSGTGVEAWAEVYTQIGASATTVTASYSNTTPTSGRTTVATSFGATGFREAQRMLPLPLQSGDYGVTAVSTITVLATTGTVGSFGVTLLYPIFWIPVPLAGVGRLWSGVMMSGGPFDLGTISDACLSLAFCPNGTTAPVVYGQANFVTY